MKNYLDTIAARATAPGRGGIGIVRISGPKVIEIIDALFIKKLKPRYAEYVSIYDEYEAVIDIGIALFFPAPHSFTGENVLEFHGHGGPVVIERVLNRLLQLGARLAKPGEFTERAFLNDKIDLLQAEAIADLIDSASVQAAKSAVRSLQGDFSKYIHKLRDDLIALRMFVEAAIDFPEEEIDFLSNGDVEGRLQGIIAQVETLLNNAKQGAILREGIDLVIVGKPNAGKSTLLNQLIGREVAIVTDIPGTTRDIMQEKILIDGIPINIKDTAGLRNSDDKVEQEGVRRAQQAMQDADHVLFIVDNQCPQDRDDLEKEVSAKTNITTIYNKIDLGNQSVHFDKATSSLYLSAKTGDGIDLLRQHIKEMAGVYNGNEDQFMARQRHLDALQKCYDVLLCGAQQLVQHKAGELLAEDLSQAQKILGEITGEFTSDDLLGRIFSTFCIGK